MNDKKYFQICSNCGGYAWEYKEKPHVGMVMSLDSIIHSGNPKNGDYTSCQKCGHVIKTDELNQENLKEINA